MNVTCPACAGRKAHTALVCGADGSAFHRIVCIACDGAGEVSQETADVMAEGEALRELRRPATLSQAAREAGVRPAQWSAVERGRNTDPEILRRCREAAQRIRESLP